MYVERSFTGFFGAANAVEVIMRRRDNIDNIVRMVPPEVGGQFQNAFYSNKIQVGRFIYDGILYYLRSVVNKKAVKTLGNFTAQNIRRRKDKRIGMRGPAI
jgi:hypothetical protein